MRFAWASTLGAAVSSAAAHFSIDGTFLLQSNLASEVDMGSNSHVSMAVVATFGDRIEGAPEWCKPDDNLSWAQKRERMQQHATLEWAKQERKSLLASNQTVPEWMDKLVIADENRGKMKWAVQESKRLKSEGAEVPQWIVQLVEEDSKWANRWAACKAAALKAAGEEVPEWMSDNGRKGIMEYAGEKMAQLQQEIDELEEQKQKEAALVRAEGDTKLARQRSLASTKASQARSASQQFRVLEQAIAELDAAEKAGSVDRLMKAMNAAKEASSLLSRILAHKLAMPGGIL